MPGVSHYQVHSLPHPTASTDHLVSHDAIPTVDPVSHHTHHFHFPEVSLHSISQKVRSHISRSGHKSHPNLWVPEADIRETSAGYYIEVEVPGVGDKESIMIQWMSPRTLVVQGVIKRPVLDSNASVGNVGDRIWEGDGDDRVEEARGSLKDSEAGDDAELQRTMSHDTVPEASIMFLLKERKVGPWMRSFTLPIDVDMRGLRAKLADGLLRIFLPKRDMKGEATATGVRLVVE